MHYVLQKGNGQRAYLHSIEGSIRNGSLPRHALWCISYLIYDHNTLYVKGCKVPRYVFSYFERELIQSIPKKYSSQMNPTVTLEDTSHSPECAALKIGGNADQLWSSPNQHTCRKKSPVKLWLGKMSDQTGRCGALNNDTDGCSIKRCSLCFREHHDF